MKITLVGLFCFALQGLIAQNVNENYYNQFDGLVNSYGSDLNTGERFEDLYLTVSDDEFRYFQAKESILGSVNYKGQNFFKATLKYDLFEDQLIYKDVSGSNPYDIILDKTLVKTFSIYGKDFEKLPETASKLSFYKNGFFEVLSKHGDFNLYMKYDKSPRMKLGEKTSYYNYTKKEFMVLEHQSKFYEITSKNDIIKILPERKDAIKLFYKNNGYLESQNKVEFMKKLFNSLSNKN